MGWPIIFDVDFQYTIADAAIIVDFGVAACGIVVHPYVVLSCVHTVAEEFVATLRAISSETREDTSYLQPGLATIDELLIPNALCDVVATSNLPVKTFPLATSILRKRDYVFNTSELLVTLDVFFALELIIVLESSSLLESSSPYGYSNSQS